MAVCYLGIGSNIGNRRKNIRLAVKKIKTLKNTQVLEFSDIIETEPVGGPAGQGKFLNAALKIHTRIPPRVLLKRLKSIEKLLGRKKSVRFGARPIDLDILLYADKVMHKNNLVIPHPRMFEREFVMKPLLQII